MKKLSDYKRLIDRILLLDGHPGLFLLKNAFSLTHLMFAIRTAPCHRRPMLLAEYDNITRSMTEALCNVHFDDNSWSQAKLHVRYGGLRLRTATDLVLPAFLSSRAASKSLVKDILHQPMSMPGDIDEVLAWLDQDHYLPSDPHKQRSWDDFQYSSTMATLVPLLNQPCLACFKAASRPESGAWLNCVPSNRVGTFVDSDTPCRRRPPHQTLSLYSSSMQMRDDGGRVHYAPFVMPFLRRAHTSPFYPKQRFEDITCKGCRPQSLELEQSSTTNKCTDGFSLEPPPCKPATQALPDCEQRLKALELWELWKVKPDDFTTGATHLSRWCCCLLNTSNNKLRRSARLFCSRDIVHARTIGS